MPRVTESSLITTLAGLEQMERERAEQERLARDAELEEQRQRERRLAAEAEAAERRARWAEQDRLRAEARERDQHEARLKAMHEALVQTARIEAEARHERERVQEVHAHERKLAELQNDVRVRSLRRRWLATLLAVLALGAVSAGLAYDAREKAQRLDQSRERIEALQRALAGAEGERERAREQRSLVETRLALVEAKLTAARNANDAAHPSRSDAALSSPSAPAVASRPLRAQGDRATPPKPCKPGLEGDPLNDCVP